MVLAGSGAAATLTRAVEIEIGRALERRVSVTGVQGLLGRTGYSAIATLRGGDGVRAEVTFAALVVGCSPKKRYLTRDGEEQ